MVEWQTRTLQERMGQPLRVQLPPSALFSSISLKPLACKGERKFFGATIRKGGHFKMSAFYLYPDDAVNDGSARASR